MSNDKEQTIGRWAAEDHQCPFKAQQRFVIGETQPSLIKGNRKVQQVAEELGFSMCWRGAYANGDKVRITAQLVDALTGNHLMSDVYERHLKDIFAIQDDVTMKVLTTLRVNLSEGESAHTFTRGTKNLEAYLKMLQAYEQNSVFNKESQTQACQFEGGRYSIRGMHGHTV
jgi:adenylate cyclase